MNASLSIEKAQNRTLKQAAKELSGQAFASLAPRRTKELFDFPVSHPRRFRDRQIMAFLKRRALVENQTGFFERLHADFWQGEGGVVFSKNCDHRFHDLFLAKQESDFKQLQSICKVRKPKQIVEFGCNSGLLLQFMTTELSGVESSTGIEINADQVKRNQASSKFDPRIKFVNADGGNWLMKHGDANTLFVTNGGVLEYFSRARLDAMLSHISNKLGPAVFFAVEPVASDHDWSRTTESIPFGDELSFSHNYTDLFESNGFEVVHQRAIEYSSWSVVATIATCNQN